MVLYTSDGTTLFETIPRSVTFAATKSYSAGMDGNKVYIDGVALASGAGGTTSGQGSLQALLQVRDDVAPTFQSQLDEIAKGLVSMFSETSTDGTTTLPGLFTWSGGTTPTSGDIIDGIAGSISVSSAVITSAGGDPMKLRDGAINGAAYDQNPDPNKSGGYTAQLDKLNNALGAKMNFNTAAGIDSNVSIMDFASNSIGWLEQYRSDADGAAENTSAALSRSDEAYSNETGVNLDEELTLMLDIEQSYKAATKILNAVDEMLKSLLDIAS